MTVTSSGGREETWPLLDLDLEKEDGKVVETTVRLVTMWTPLHRDKPDQGASTRGVRPRHPSAKPRGPEAPCMHRVGRQCSGTLPCPSLVTESQVSRHLCLPPTGKMEPKGKN